MGRVHGRRLLQPGRVMRAGVKVAAAAAIGIYIFSAGHPAYGAGHSHNAAVRYAESRLGCPYVWGGTGPCSSGYDCSGLAMRAEAAAGIWIPRTSEEQWLAGRRISPSAVRPGDLVFFAGGDGTMTAPGHVGIVVNARLHLMIDAPEPGTDVREESYEWPDLVGFTDPGSR
jgi:cell wall-associated NlpC family hydrolase